MQDLSIVESKVGILTLYHYGYTQAPIRIPVISVFTINLSCFFYKVKDLGDYSCKIFPKMERDFPTILFLCCFFRQFSSLDFKVLNVVLANKLLQYVTGNQ